VAVLGHCASAAVDERPQRAPLNVLRADGQQIDLSKCDAGTLLVATQQGRQTQAYACRDLIGRLRDALQLPRTTRPKHVSVGRRVRCLLVLPEVEPVTERINGALAPKRSATRGRRLAALITHAQGGFSPVRGTPLIPNRRVYK
jgi:hypothetical protein